jgi:large subunit ribosomal protein L16
MGKGKGAIDYWAGRVKSGTVIASFKKITKKISHKVLTVSATKVPGRVYVFTKIQQR